MTNSYTGGCHACSNVQYVPEAQKQNTLTSCTRSADTILPTSLVFPSPQSHWVTYCGPLVMALLPTFFYVLLIVHLSIILLNNQLNAQNIVL